MRKLVLVAMAAALLFGEQPAGWAQDYFAIARDVEAAHPAEDARRKAEAGDFRLIQITGAWSGSSLPGVICFLPATQEGLHLDLFFSDVSYGEGDVALRAAQESYARVFNRHVVEHRSYPFRDLCRPRATDEEQQNAANYFGAEEWRRRARSAAPDGTLASAARLGDRRSLRTLLERGADANQFDVWGMTPLAWSALRGDEESARALIQRGANPNLSCERCATPLNLAVNGGSARIIDLLVGVGADLDADSNSLHDFRTDQLPGGPPVSAATALGRHAILRRLLAAGADPNATSNTIPVTFTAVSLGDIESLRMLLAAGADPNVHRRGVALIQDAAARNSEEIVRTLVDAGVMQEARSDFEERMWRLAVSLDRNAILVSLVSGGAHVHALPIHQRNEFAAAITAGDAAAVAGLLVEADRRWSDRRRAIEAGDVGTFQRLLSEDAGLMRGHGESELIFAIENGKEEIVRLLLAAGADPTAVAHPDSTLKAESSRPVEWSVADQGSVFGRVPYRYVAQVTPAMLAFNTGPLTMVELVVDGVPPNDYNVTDPHNSYLDEAFRGFRRHRDARIIERARTLGGAPPLTGLQADQFLADICFWTREDAPAVMRPYLEMGYRPRTASDPPAIPGWPSDDRALSKCIGVSPAATMLLLDYGADPNQSSSIGEPALWDAVSSLNDPNASTDLLERLLTAGADPNPPGYRDVLAYAIARSRVRNVETAARFARAVQILQAHGARVKEEEDISPDRPQLLPIR